MNKNHPLIMGILNVTEDSFYDGGKYVAAGDAIVHAHRMMEEGADIIDVGAQSTRPGSKAISETLEIERLKPILSELLRDSHIHLSVDTDKPAVAKMALDLGVRMINDISGLRHENMAPLIASYNAEVVIMHMKGTPETMQHEPVYDNVISEIKSFLEKQVMHAKEHGITKIWIDPGIGFGKRLEDNLEIIHKLKSFKSIGCPILVGASRKSFIGQLNGNIPPEERLPGTLAAHILAIQNGADMIRVHDVKEHKQVLEIL